MRADTRGAASYRPQYIALTQSAMPAIDVDIASAIAIISVD
jgi:hypothetical protein